MEPGKTSREDARQADKAALALIEEALAQDVPRQGQVQWLKDQPGLDPQITDRALRLLDKVTEPEGELNILGDVIAQLTDLSDSQIGDYKIERLLGQGGMGAVYLAHREHDGVRQTVALKVLPGVGINAERFLVEQQALASLHHPYIASFIEMGRTENDVPFYVMEYVEGKQITEFADDQKLSIEQRLELWMKLCTAVRSSHEKLVVHRDIKPGNVLVTPDGIPKLLDFGIAKILSADNTDLTEALGAQITLDYASPERIAHGISSTAEDAYALAVLLYELALGERPFHRSSDNMQALLTSVAQQDAPSMLDAFDTWSPEQQSQIAQLRGLKPQAMRGVLRSDLSLILNKALLSDASGRYTSIDAMFADIQSFLGCLPVQASRLSTGYKLKRFAQRHRAGVAMSAATVLLVIASFAIVLLQMAETNRQLERANTTTTFLSDVLKAPSNRWDSELRIGTDASMQDVLRSAAEQLRVATGLSAATKVELMSAISESMMMWNIEAESLQIASEALDLAHLSLADDDPMLFRALANMAVVSNAQGSAESLAKAAESAQAALEWVQVYEPENLYKQSMALGALGNNQGIRGNDAASHPLLRARYCAVGLRWGSA